MLGVSSSQLRNKNLKESLFVSQKQITQSNRKGVTSKDKKRNNDLEHMGKVNGIIGPVETMAYAADSSDDLSRADAPQHARTGLLNDALLTQSTMINKKKTI